jgi:DNA-binding HxlR family transcriptional regulator
MPKTQYVCPTLSLVHLMGKRWTIPIVETLHSPSRRMQFSSMQLLLKKITAKNLSRSLKELSNARRVRKIETREKGILHTEYALTEKGVAFRSFITSAKKLGVCLYDIDSSCISKQCINCIVKKS